MHSSERRGLSPEDRPPGENKPRSSLHFLCAASCAFAAATTDSTVNPNFFCNSLSGADAPNVFIPTTVPVGPTYCCQPNVDACSTATRAVTPAGITLSRYSSG